jgi:DNA-binding response OmpR family regulator
MQNDNSFILKKILIVDDSPEAIEVLGNALLKHYTCQVALTGEKAINLLNTTKELPDLILLDVMMPGMDGYEVCKRIKMDARLKDIPIIFISALNETFDKVQAFETGGVDYITKPFQREEIMARVSTHLEIAQSRKEIKDLYTKTLQGTLSAINDMLAIANPEVSKISNSMRLYAEMIMQELSIKDSWDLKLACLLSGIGMLAEAIKKKEEGVFTYAKNSVDRQNINSTFDINKANEALALSTQVIENIPKLERVVKIINISMSPLGEANRNTSVSNINRDILKGHILRVLINYFYKIKHEENYMLVLKQMRNDQEEFYLQQILDALDKVQNSLSISHISEVKINELKPKMILAKDICSLEGKVLLKAGYELSESLIAVLKNLKAIKDVKIKIIKKFDAI